MSFFSTARRSAAEEYGKARAEKYGRQERRLRWLALFAVIIFLGYCYMIGK